MTSDHSYRGRTVAGNVTHWIIDRFALRPIYDHVLDRRVPRAPWYSGDGATLLMLLGVQVVTGAMLALTYSPTLETAYESVLEITERQSMGWFIRGLHYWAAGWMVVVLFYHLFRQIVLAGYKSPREGTWLIGVLLFAAVLFMSYSGYLLRWDERAVHGIRVMLHMLYRVPYVGESLVLIAQGGSDVGPRTLTRLYSMHVIIVPLTILALAAYHLYLIVQRGTITLGERQQGAESSKEQKRIYEREAASPRKGEDFYPRTMFKTGATGAAVLTLVVVLTITFGPARLGREANFTGSPQPAEEWWFWWYSGLIALLPPTIAPWFVVLFPVFVLTFLVLLPFVDRGPDRGAKARPIWTVVVIVIAIAMLALSDYRRRSSFTAWPDSQPPRVPAHIQLTESAEHGRILFATYGCNRCHAVAGDGRALGPDIAELREVRSFTAIREYILHPPSHVAMPSYQGRLTEDELRALTDFCHIAQTFPRRL